MAIYHLSVSIVSRARGERVVAVAAARAGERLRDEYYGLTHRFNCESGDHSEIMAPAGSASWVRHRQTLWNRVEASERRKDAQLARALDIALPMELTCAQCVALIRDFVKQEFVDLGMIADVSLRRVGEANPQALVLLTLRRAIGDGFGPKVREWNRKSALADWRQGWAERANHHLAQAGQDVRIDHRTLEAQQIALTPSRRIGIGPQGAADRPLPGYLRARIAEQRAIVAENGDALLADPGAALRFLTRQRATFTKLELGRFLQSRTVDSAQREAVEELLMNSGELVPVDTTSAGEQRYTSRDLLAAAQSLIRRAAVLNARRGHGSVGSPSVDVGTDTLAYLLADGDCKVLALPETSKAELLGAARDAWQARGSRVRGAALSRHAVRRLQSVAGVASGTLAELEQGWARGHVGLAPNDVLIVDGAEMIGVRDLERLLGVVERARAKLVLIADAMQLQTVRRISPLRALLP